jgi:hypothetical protein
MDTGDKLVPRKIPYLKHEIGGEEMEVLVKPLFNMTESDGSSYTEPERLFLIPRSVAVEQLVTSLGIVFGRLVKVGVLFPNASDYCMIYQQHQLNAAIAEAQTQCQAAGGADRLKLVLYVFIAENGEALTRVSIDSLLPKDSAMRAGTKSVRQMDVVCQP